MRFESMNICLECGKRCALRSAKPDDAKDMIAFLKTIASETSFLLRNEEEIAFTEVGAREFFENGLADPRGIMMIAEVDGEIAGNCAISPASNLRKTAHRCTLSIAVRKEYWRRGIASAMMKSALQLAHEMSYTQVELEVIEGTIAQSVCTSDSDSEQQYSARAIRYDDGAFRDMFLMQKTL